MVELATSRYQEGDLIRESGLMPIGISVGRPKFPLGYTPLYMEELAPFGLLQIEDPVEFDRGYIERLERVGTDALQNCFAAICAEHETPGLVLLCFEPVGQPCHRHLFSRWWEHQSGETVPELRERCRGVRVRDLVRA